MASLAVLKKPLIRNTPERTKKPYYGFDLAKAIRLRAKGASYEEIGKVVGRHKTSVIRALNGIDEQIQLAPAYQEHAAKLWDGKAMQALAACTPAKIDSLDAYKAILVAGISADKSRLYHNESTSNVSIRGISDHFTNELASITSKREELEAKLAQDE